MSTTFQKYKVFPVISKRRYYKFRRSLTEIWNLGTGRMFHRQIQCQTEWELYIRYVRYSRRAVARRIRGTSAGTRESNGGRRGPLANRGASLMVVLSRFPKKHPACSFRRGAFIGASFGVAFSTGKRDSHHRWVTATRAPNTARALARVRTCPFGQVTTISFAVKFLS